MWRTSHVQQEGNLDIFITTLSIDICVNTIKLNKLKSMQAQLVRMKQTPIQAFYEWSFVRYASARTLHSEFGYTLDVTESSTLYAPARLADVCVLLRDKFDGLNEFKLWRAC